ncbi:hypothetical protein D3C74_417630 [compost metagenome]
MPVKPRKLPICPLKIVTAIPAVNPMVTGRGMNLINVPSRSSPISTRKIPARKPAISRFSYPYCSTMARRIGIKAPVGPPIWNRDPPNSEIRIPAIIVVYNPYSGLTPDAIAKAIPRGMATMPTIHPEIKSLRKEAAL